jgi:ubiquinone biosynthesis monooxygenase Coq7
MLENFIVPFDRALRTLTGTVSPARPTPGERIAEPDLTAHERRDAAGLMRVNHTGEVCAQALYAAQALVARDGDVRARYAEAAREEEDHLAWTQERLDDFAQRPSLLNPVWYAGAFAIGAAAGLAGDRTNLGFVVETERQVEAHLGEHLEKLPADDVRSRTIVHAMKEDEARHADKALAAGAQSLPAPVPDLMRFASWVMKTVAYRI